MKLLLSSAVFLLTTSAAIADVLTLLPSTQRVTFTGLGTNSSGAGTSRISSFGACNYDGSRTTCTVSGAYTGLGGGTYQLVLNYPGNGVSPLTTVASPIGSDTVYFALSAGSLISTITPNGGSTLQIYDLNFSIFFSGSTDACTGVSQCGVGAVGVTPNATISGPVSGQLDPTPVIRSLVTATGYGGSPMIAPATWVEIYGQNLSTTLKQVWGGSDFNGVQAPAALGGTTVKVGGQSAFVEFVSPEQVNVQIPSTVATGRQPVVVTTAGGSSVATMVTVNSVQPGILAPGALSINGIQYVEALFPDGFTYVLPPVAGIPTRRAKPGDIVLLYGIGFGPVSPNINAGLIVQQSNALSGFTISIGGQPATVQFAGLVSGFLGLYQFNVVIPPISASDSTPVTFAINGNTGTQTLYLPISN